MTEQPQQEAQEASIAPEQHTTAIFIANPTSGSYIQNERQIKDSIDYLNERDWQVELKLTEQAGDARRFARAAVEEGVDVVVAVGGDGTINEVIQELAGSETALGVFPSGTVNVWARETGIPFDSLGACDVLLNGKVRRIDLGRLNHERYFLLMAGIGLSGEVTHAIEKHPAKRFGVLSYLFIGTQLGLHFPNFQAILQIGKRAIRRRALEVVIGNTQLYAGAIKFTWRARSDDGKLDVCIVRTKSILGRVGVVIDFLLRRPERKQWVIYETGEEIKLHTNKPVAIQIDGDPAGRTTERGYPPTTFTVVPGALKVIVPQHPPEDLFSPEEGDTTTTVNLSPASPSR